MFEGRPFQHSTGDGKYCGYFRLNPRKIGSAPPQSAVVSESGDVSVTASSSTYGATTA